MDTTTTTTMSAMSVGVCDGVWDCQGPGSKKPHPKSPQQGTAKNVSSPRVELFPELEEDEEHNHPSEDMDSFDDGDELDYDYESVTDDESDDQEFDDWACPAEGEHVAVEWSDCDEVCWEDEEDEEDDASVVDQPVVPPFWFGWEEEDQLALLFERYEEYLSAIIPRGMFIGSIDRTCVSMDAMQTFDRVNVVEKATGFAPDSSLPVFKHITVLSTWDAEDGLPVSCFVIEPDNRSLCQFWEQRSAHAMHTATVRVRSCVTALPVFGGEKFAHAHVARHDDEMYYSHPTVTFAPSSVPRSSFPSSLYESFCPPRELCGGLVVD